MKLRPRVFEPEMLILIDILLIILPNFLLASKQLPVETILLWQRDFIYIKPRDLNNDSIDELITISDCCIQPFDQKINALIASRCLERGTFKPNNSICGGLDKEKIWATFNRNNSLFLYDIWARREIFVTKGWDIASPKGWDGSCVNVILEDINNDGRLEAVMQVVTGYDRKPRGIFVIDWETGQLLWKYLCGPVIENLLLKDIDGDKKNEILFGSFAPGNGNVDNGTDDLYTYVFMLNADGSPRWIKSIGHYSSLVKVHWISNSRNDSLHIVVVEIGSPAGNRKCDSIFILDALTGIVIKKAQYGCFNNDFTIVNDRKGNPLIVVGGSDDTLRILDANLRLIRKKCLDGGGCRRITSGYFTGRKEPEIVVSTINDKLILYNLQLKCLSSYQTDVIQELKLVRYLNKTKLLIQLEKNNGTRWLCLEFNIIPYLNRGIPLTSVIIGTIFLLLLFVIAMVYVRYTQTRDIRTVIKGLTGKSGVIEINHKGEIDNISPRAREIFGISDKDKKQTLEKLSEIKQLNPVLELAKSMIFDVKISSPQEIAISLSQEQSYLVRCIRVKKGVLITFEDISAVEYMKRITSWAPVAQKLAHGIKTPLMNIQLSAEQLESACEPVREKTDKIIDGIKSEAKRLKKLTDNFMRFTQFAPLNLVSENINNIINDLCNKYTFSLPSQIKIECNLSNDLPKIMVDRKEIENAVSIIIENAVDALVGMEIKKQGVLSIKTFLLEKQENDISKKKVVIEISDNGKGIPEKYLNELFKPYFTYGKPQGTGLGLTLAKKIIESHNGNIEIRSKEGIGTQVSVYLPV